MACPWDNRETFERFLYDYLVKNGKSEIAEIFRVEAKLTFDPMSPPDVDVHDGFLHEWWLIFHDIFNDIIKGHQQNSSNHNEGSSNMAKEMVDVKTQQGNLSQSRDQEMTEKMIRELIGCTDLDMKP